MAERAQKLLEDPEALNRFDNEARVAVGAHHLNFSHAALQVNSWSSKTDEAKQNAAINDTTLSFGERALLVLQQEENSLSPFIVKITP